MAEPALVLPSSCGAGAFHRGLGPKVPSLGGDAVGCMRVGEVASLVGCEPTYELLMRIVRAVLLFDEIENQLVSDLGHRVSPNFTIPHRTLRPAIEAKLGKIPYRTKTLCFARSNRVPGVRSNIVAKEGFDHRSHEISVWSSLLAAMFVLTGRGVP